MRLSILKKQERNNFTPLKSPEEKHTHTHTHTLPVVFLNTNGKHTEREIREPIHFTIASKITLREH